MSAVNKKTIVDCGTTNGIRVLICKENKNRYLGCHCVDQETGLSVLISPTNIESLVDTVIVVRSIKTCKSKYGKEKIPCIKCSCFKFFNKANPYTDSAL